MCSKKIKYGLPMLGKKMVCACSKFESYEFSVPQSTKQSSSKFPKYGLAY
jgi:hypothetical protein